MLGIIFVRNQRRMRMLLPYAGFKLAVNGRFVGVAHNCNFSVTFRFKPKEQA